MRIPLADRTRNKLRRFDVVHTKHLQHAGIGKEGVGTFAIETTELMNVLKDRSELHAVACHQPHGTLDSSQPSQARKLVEQEQHGLVSGSLFLLPAQCR